MNTPIDWIIHYVSDNTAEYENARNIHTHGMDNYNHMDFQIVLPLEQKQAMLLLNTIGICVQQGNSFYEGEYEAGIFSCPFRLKEYTETGRTLLRMILPDPQMRFPDDPLCDELYCNQEIVFS